MSLARTPRARTGGRRPRSRVSALATVVVAAGLLTGMLAACSRVSAMGGGRGAGAQSGNDTAQAAHPAAGPPRSSPATPGGSTDPVPATASRPLAGLVIAFLGTLVFTGNFDVLRAQACIQYVYTLAAVGAGALYAGARRSFGRVGALVAGLLLAGASRTQATPAEVPLFRISTLTPGLRDSKAFLYTSVRSLGNEVTMLSTCCAGPIALYALWAMAA